MPGATDTAATSAAATRVVLSYPADLSEWGRTRVEASSFLAYLSKAHDTAAVGDEWDEFVGAGCCGGTVDLSLVVEHVEGGSALTSETEIAFRERGVSGAED